MPLAGTVVVHANCEPVCGKVGEQAPQAAPVLAWRALPVQQAAPPGL